MCVTRQDVLVTLVLGRLFPIVSVPSSLSRIKHPVGFLLLVTILNVYMLGTTKSSPDNIVSAVLTECETVEICDPCGVFVCQMIRYLTKEAD